MDFSEQQMREQIKFMSGIDIGLFSKDEIGNLRWENVQFEVEYERNVTAKGHFSVKKANVIHFSVEIYCAEYDFTFYIDQQTNAQSVGVLMDDRFEVRPISNQGRLSCIQVKCEDGRAFEMVKNGDLNVVDHLRPLPNWK
ncbi:hypothetical protein [Echinimonas agarilytica]|uniref:Uncharacterized protein n=1 Tax=Echinimonas agarilytica TaxID=1215918 RepID=A0AA41W6S1_9GAMM|nr:hypothetical protein [Echinimonas agarilytica]MCM2679727.1 hypothetical protein [Echinimonas agarilytica]